MQTKEQHTVWSRKQYSKRRRKVLRLLGGKCSSCGSERKLQVDHVDPDTKDAQVTDLYRHSWARILEEIKKCQLLCFKCHVDKSMRESGQVSARGVHGTHGGYRYCGPPKCPVCVAFHTQYEKEYRRRVRLGLHKIKARSIQ